MILSGIIVWVYFRLCAKWQICFFWNYAYSTIKRKNRGITSVFKCPTDFRLLWITLWNIFNLLSGTVNYCISLYVCLQYSGSSELHGMTESICSSVGTSPHSGILSADTANSCTHQDHFALLFQWYSSHQHLHQVLYPYHKTKNSFCWWKMDWT